ncbi:MAG: galactokinase, partial [Pseudomonadota bacterium]
GLTVIELLRFDIVTAHLGTALLLDTDTLEHTAVPLPDSHAFCVVHSGVTRRLDDGRYGARKRECDQARTEFGAGPLCQIDPRDVASARGVSEISRRRARHCATEHRRVLAAADALGKGDVCLLGNLMNSSHASMAQDFEVSLPAIDALVEDACALGAVGARLTGGGFGGCIVACVGEHERSRWIDALLARHPQAFVVH